jgi:formamidopyrimidine-DNA glycosylase
MPELPDVVVYLECLQARVLDAPLTRLRVASPFLVRSVDPPLASATGKHVRSLRRLGKRLVLGLDDELFLVLHLMIAGRLRWRPVGAKIPGRIGLAAFDFPTGTVVLTEAGSHKRASLHLVRGEPALRTLAPAGLEVLECDRDAFAAALTRARHTLKRTLTDPHTLSGIGNAYSDEILHHARLSPLRMTDALTGEELTRLFAACRSVLVTWTNRLRREVGAGFPERVTAFRDGMAVHGRFGAPCPACGAAVQRIVYADTETNYCARCQTGGKRLADRALSRLLHDEWSREVPEATPGAPRPPTRRRRRIR